MNFYSKTLSEQYIHIPSTVARNANGKRILHIEPTSKKRVYQRSMNRFVETTDYGMDVRIGKMSRLSLEDTTDYSMDVLIGKMSRLSLEDTREPEEVIVWKGNNIVCH